MTICRLPRFGLSIEPAEYYGYRYAAHVAWWLILFGAPSPEGGE